MAFRMSIDLADLQLGGDAASCLPGCLPGDGGGPHHYTPPDPKQHAKHLEVERQFDFLSDIAQTCGDLGIDDLVHRHGWGHGAAVQLAEGLVPNVDRGRPGSPAFLLPPPAVPAVPNLMASSTLSSSSSMMAPAPGAGALPERPRPFRNAGPQVMIDPVTGSPVLVRRRPPRPAKINPDLDRLRTGIDCALSESETTSAHLPGAGSFEADNVGAAGPRTRTRSPGPPHRRRSSHRSPIPARWTDSLLGMTTKELNQFFKSQEFGADEIAELKTCRRRIKNRGYTRESRKRTYSAGRAATSPRA